MGLCGDVVVVRWGGVGSSTTSVRNLRFWMINVVGGIFGLNVFSLPEGDFVMAATSGKTL